MIPYTFLGTGYGTYLLAVPALVSAAVGIATYRTARRGTLASERTEAVVEDIDHARLVEEALAEGEALPTHVFSKKQHDAFIAELDAGGWLGNAEAVNTYLLRIKRPNDQSLPNAFIKYDNPDKTKQCAWNAYLSHCDVCQNHTIPHGYHGIGDRPWSCPGRDGENNYSEFPYVGYRVHMQIEVVAS